MTDMEPEGRTFGRELAPEVELEALKQKVEWIQEAGADGQRDLKRRMTSVEEEVIKALERINVLRGDIDAATVRIAQLETSRFNFETVDDAQAQALIDLRERLKRLEDQTKFETSEDDTRIRINQLMALPSTNQLMTLSPTHHETFKRGAEHGLETAILRVRRYMGGHFSEATIGGVVQAIQVGEDRGLPLVDLEPEKIIDHAFRFSAPDRRHCSYRKNHRGPKCDALRSEHTYAQAQPEDSI